jgi:hypothetical protein
MYREEVVRDTGIEMTEAQFLLIDNYYQKAYNGTVNKKKIYAELKKHGIEEFCRKHKKYKLS